MLFQTMIMVGSGDLAERSSAFGVESAEHMINNQLRSHFNVVRAADDASTLADWHNRLQGLAASTRLGIPITLSTDQRNHFTEALGRAVALPLTSQYAGCCGRSSSSGSSTTRTLILIMRPPPLARPSSLPPEPMPSGKRTHC